ncbi:Clavaminate synthase-like protein [Aaosphaeria arxii CBS 175.79]|uniref:Clavaminate synthase-like protein n=1 Tax=Aaosphaeria arxii CBS 175.79 TaxID=1450172 RepID=A0A6A5XPU3_9PLEO|nr:Clavaminate synthase-like protein [Aaosphaeria arxii CBS 175.79]KAF2014857.1 Clavaminate synthase-like protein [Aaosphaeria arxii CBS 175.79]
MSAIHIDKAVAKDDLEIPLIDFSLFLSGDTATKQATAQAVLEGFQKSGFIYLKGHGISPTTISNVFSHSAKFFARPQQQKDALAWYSPEANRGYTAQGREKVTDLEEIDDVAKLRTSIPDLKESLEIGREGEAGMPNMWPSVDGDEEAKTFKEVMVGFHETCKGLHMELMRAIAIGMGIEENWFDLYTDVGDNTLRLLHYPGVSKSVFKREDGQLQVRAGEHSDYGSITLLFQDARGGLQVRSPRGTFVDAEPIPGTIVINAGDLLARWSNDTIKSTKHRVVEPPPQMREDQSSFYPPRYSVAYFCNPNFERIIEAIPGTYEESGKKYGAIKSGDYLVRRLTATY